MGAKLIINNSINQYNNKVIRDLYYSNNNKNKCYRRNRTMKQYKTIKIYRQSKSTITKWMQCCLSPYIHIYHHKFKTYQNNLWL